MFEEFQTKGIVFCLKSPSPSWSILSRTCQLTNREIGYFSSNKTQLKTKEIYFIAMLQKLKRELEKCQILADSIHSPISLIVHDIFHPKICFLVLKPLGICFLNLKRLQTP